MGTLDSFAEKSPISNGPATEKQDGFGGGTVQTFAETVSLSRSSTPMGVFTDQSMGTVESFAERVPLKRQPHRGYEAGTPANSESENPGA